LWDPASGKPTHHKMTRLEKKHSSSCPPHKSLHTSYNTSYSIKVSGPTTANTDHTIHSFCRGGMTGKCSTGQGLYSGQL
jgi:hypothetical protein